MIRRMAVAIGVAFLLAGCAAGPVQSGTDPAFRGEWTLVRAADHKGDFNLYGMSITLAVTASSTAGGKTPCNTYGATITGDPSAVRVHPTFVTMIACLDPARGEIETRYLAALDGVTHADVRPGLMLLRGKDIQLDFKLDVPENPGGTP